MNAFTTTPAADGLPESLTAGPAPSVSVIVRCKNAEETLAEALKALFTQTFTDFELIVADSGSRDRSLSWLAAWPHRLIQIAPEDYFPGRVLNQACAAARGELLVFLNSDVVMLDDQALSELLAPFDNPAVKASFARQLPRPEADPWVRRDYALAFPAEGSAPDWLPLSLPLAAMRRSAWQAMPFYTWAWGSEDSEWGHRARARGWQVVYTSASRVMHSHNYTLRQLWGRRFIEGEADAWMQPGAYALHKLPLRWARDVLKDLRLCLAGRDWPQAALALPRRWVFHWAHLQGWRLGRARLRSGSSDASLGQRTVLARHPAR